MTEPWEVTDEMRAAADEHDRLLPQEHDMRPWTAAELPAVREAMKVYAKEPDKEPEKPAMTPIRVTSRPAKTSRPANRKRAERMAAQRRGGWTYKAIGQWWGVSPQRVRQIIQQYKACLAAERAQAYRDRIKCLTARPVSRKEIVAVLQWESLWGALGRFADG